MIGKILSVLWNGIDFQKDSIKQYEMLNSADISKEVREQLITEITRARITYGKWELAIIYTTYTLIIIFAGIYVFL